MMTSKKVLSADTLARVMGMMSTTVLQNAFIKRKRMQCAMDENYLSKVLGSQ